jgi:RimJ/RimL family protein N-acetyltransferase
MLPICELNETNDHQILDHLFALNEDDRRLRFFSNITNVGIESYVERIRWNGDVCFGCFSGANLVAFVHLGKVDSDQYELGMSVSDEYKGKGLGVDLMKRIITWCKASGVTKLVMECLRDNKPMQTIAKKLGMRIVNDHETALAEAAICTTFSERIREIQKNMIYENIAIIDKSVRSFYNQALSWGIHNAK